MADITVTVDVSEAVAALKGISGPALQTKLSGALREAALFGERTVVGFTPVKTDALRGSIGSKQTGALGWKIASSLRYAPFVEDDTRAHTITPKGKRLRFTVGGSVVYARRVRHPGTKGARMFKRSVPIITAQLPSIAAKHLKP